MNWLPGFPCRIQKAMALRVASLTFLLALTTTSAALAAEALPGESCAGLDSGTYRQSSGPEVPGAGHLLVCDGTNWQPVLSYNDDGEITKIGNQTCGNGDVLTFDSVIWTCGAGGGGSSLWEEVSGVLRPVSAGTNLAWGLNVKSSGTNSTALGRGVLVDSIRSSGSGSFAGGQTSGTSGVIEATGNGSFAFGGGGGSPITASGWGSVAMGSNAAGAIISSGRGSIALGYANGNDLADSSLQATGNGAMAWGAAMDNSLGPSSHYQNGDVRLQMRQFEN